MNTAALNRYLRRRSPILRPGRIGLSAALAAALFCGCGAAPKKTPAPAAPPGAEEFAALDEMFQNLAMELLALVPETTNGCCSFYIEDLATGRALGFRENEPYDGWSILKVSVMATVLRKVGQGKFSLQDALLAEPPASDAAAGREGGKQSEATVREMLERMIRFSDNAAATALARLFSASEFFGDLEAMAAGPVERPGVAGAPPKISARQYGNILHAFYRGDYLGGELSQFALELLAGAVHDTQLPAGVPKEIRVAHKVGFNAESGDFHDCGIVFLPRRPYIICVMSSGSDRETADAVISAVSAAVYRRFSAFD